MYSVCSKTAAAWYQLFAWVGRRAGVDVEVIDHPAPAPLEDLWARDDLGLVFMCGWPFAMAGYRHRLIAAPVPKPSRYEGRPIYFTDLAVHKNSPFHKLEDTFGRRLAWTVEHSQSGFNAVRYHLLHYLIPGGKKLYMESVGPVISPIGSLKCLIENRADIAPLDSFTYDLMKANAPNMVENIRVVATTDAAPIPPLVASPNANDEDCKRLTSALLDAAQAPILRETMDTLLLRGFAKVEPAYYYVTEERARAATEAGYLLPG
jgi:ABC-type phosphate/phosphonate transport system substrate-binding protein